MYKTSAIGTISVLSLLIVAACSQTGEVDPPQGRYLGQTPPGMTAELFAPDLADPDESLGCSGFLSDGTVFVYSSMKGGGDWRFRPILVTELRQGRWTEPKLAPFSSYTSLDN